MKYVALPVAAMLEQFASFGFSTYNLIALRDYMTAYSRGWGSQVTTSVKDLTGKAPRTIGDFARDFASAFGKR